MRITSLVAGSAVLALAASGLTGSTALATTGSGTSASPPVDATLDGPLRARADGIKLKITDDATVRSFTLTYASGGYSGWHQHPGIVLAVVASGTVKRKLPCRHAQTFTAGQAFTEVGPHYVFNADKTPEAKGTPAVLLITQIVPYGTTKFRDEVDQPICHPRT